MKKLSIAALIISLVALIISIYVWTGGFGSAGTAVGVPISSNNTTGGGGGKGGGTGGQETFTQQQQVILGRRGQLATFIVRTLRAPSQQVLKITAQEVTYAGGANTVVAGLYISNIEVLSGATATATQLNAITQPTSSAQNAAYLSSLDAIANSLDLVAAKTTIAQTFVPIAGDNSNSTRVNLWVVDNATQVVGITQASGISAVKDLMRRMPVKLPPD
ncbi:MAG: hypothetical protein U0517_03325 [Candidatus Andersenbacteria bacterium]